MAFFSSKAADRDMRSLKRSMSTDRLRRGTNASASSGGTFGKVAIAESAPALPSTLGMASGSWKPPVIEKGKGKEKETKRVSPPVSTGSKKKTSPTPTRTSTGKTSPAKSASPNGSPRSSILKARSSPDLKASSSKNAPPPPPSPPMTGAGAGASISNSVTTSRLTTPPTIHHQQQPNKAQQHHRQYKSSAAGSISDSTSPVEVNMKRLLSKPATSPSSSSAKRNETSDSEHSLGIVIPAFNRPYRSRVTTAPTSSAASVASGLRFFSSSSSASASSPRHLSAHTSEPEYAYSSSPLRGSGSSVLPRARDPLPSPFIDNLRTGGYITASSSGSCSSPIARGLSNPTMSGLGHSRSASVSTSLPSSPPDTPFMGNTSDYFSARERERERLKQSNRPARRLSVGGNIVLNVATASSSRLSPHSPAPSHSKLSPRSADTSRGQSNSRSPSPRIPPSPSSIPSQPSPNPTSSNTTSTKRRQSPPPIPSGLTPAEIVAHQYKLQERRREELAKGTPEEQERDRLREREGVERERNKRLRERVVSMKTEPEKERGRERPQVAGSIAETRSEVAGDKSTPYYTVVGSTSGRVVAIGTPRDSAWGLFDPKDDSLVSAKQARTYDVETRAWVHTYKPPNSSGGLSGRLTRKLSGKFRRESSRTREEKENMGASPSIQKTTTTITTNVSEDGHTLTRIVTDVSRRPSVQERRSMTLPRETRKSLKLSIDGFVPILSTEPDSGKALPSAGNGTSAKTFVHVSGTKWELDEHGPEPAAVKKLVKSKEQDKREGKEKCKEKEGDGSGKLWRIVKKISSTALKDKFHRGDGNDTPPPVPALPKELLGLNSNGVTSPVPSVPFPSTRHTMDDSDSAGTKDTKEQLEPCKLRKIKSKPSLSHRKPTSPPLPISPVKTSPMSGGGRSITTMFSSSPPAANAGTTRGAGHHRPSTTTRSSSPQSTSDIASQFFHRTSSRSSTSSLGELHQAITSNANARSLTHPMLGEPIVPPEQLYWMNKGVEEEVATTAVESRKVHAPQTRPRVLDRRMSERISYAEESFCSLPVPPPRRTPMNANVDASVKLKTEGSYSLTLDTESHSPMIPTFSADNAVNTFGRKSTPPVASANPTLSAVSSSTSFGADFGVTTSVPVSTSPPPTRPRRNSKRLASNSSSSTSTSTPTLDSDSLRTDLFGLNGPEHKIRIERESFGSQASTARPYSRDDRHDSFYSLSFSDTDSDLRSSSPVLIASTHESADDDSSNARLQNAIRFRELKDTQKSTWTDQQKVDKWNDLLDQSEKAGGTLYVGLGVGGLLSDRLGRKKVRT